MEYSILLIHILSFTFTTPAFVFHRISPSWPTQNSDGIPEHRSVRIQNVRMFKSGMQFTKEETKKSPKDCSRLKSCEFLYTCPCAPFYRETKGLLRSENTLKSKEYSWCEHVHECLYIPWFAVLISYIYKSAPSSHAKPGLLKLRL
jgi:hypothetical protein